MDRAACKLAIIVATLALVETAAAQSVAVRVRAQVSSGDAKPALILRANEDVSSLALELRVGEGPKRRVEIDRLARGQERVVEIEAGVGKSQVRGKLSAILADGSEVTSELAFAVEVLAALSIEVPDEKIDLKNNRLQLRASEPTDHCTREVLFSDASTDTGLTDFAGAEPGAWLPLTWRHPPEESVVLRIRLFCASKQGREAGVELFPWWIEIPHEDVTFASGKAEVTPGELPKIERARAEIERAVARYGKLVALKLYVSGHTDTVGSQELNERLSLYRAEAIARRLREIGVRLPLFFCGFGKEHLAVPTKDGVAEPRNRRARYILAVNPPLVGSWHRLED